MFDRNDNIYDSPGIMSTAFHGALYAGLGVGAISFLKNPEATKKYAMKAVDKVMPLTKPNYTPYENSINAFKEGLSSVGKNRALRSNLSSSLKNSAIENTMSTFESKSVNIPSGLFKGTSKTVSSEFAYKGFEEITDSLGNSIGGRIKDALTKLNDQMGSDKLNLNDVSWTGTTAHIPTDSEKTLSISFGKTTEEGASLVRNGNAFYSAPMFYGHDLNAAKDGIAGLNINDWNTQILNMLENNSVLDHTAAAAVNDMSVMHLLDNGSLKAIQKKLEMASHGSDAQEALKAESMYSKLKLALATTTSSLHQSASFVNPMNVTQQLVNAGNIVPDIGNVYDISTNSSMKGFGARQLELNQFRSIYDREGRSTSKAVRDTLYSAGEIKPSNIRINGENLVEAAQRNLNASNLLNEIQNYGGVNGLVSQSQVASGTRNIGGEIYGPAITEGYKSLSSSQYSSARPNNRYKYGYRYGVENNTTRTSVLSQRLLNTNSSMNSFGFIDFNGDEGIYINSKNASNFTHDTYIQAGFDGYTDQIGNQKLNIYNKRTGKSLRAEHQIQLNRNIHVPTREEIELGRKAPQYTLSDLYNLSEDSELYKLMQGGDYEIRFSKGTQIGIRKDARPIGGLGNDHGIDIIDSITSLKGEGIMGFDEFNAFIGLNQRNEAGKLISETGKTSLPLRLRSTATKGALTSTAQRSSISYIDFGTRLGVSAAALNAGEISYGGNILNEAENLIGADLFKAVFPKLVPGTDILQTGKQQQEMLQTLHSMLLGETQALWSGSASQVILEGEKAKTFNKYLLNPLQSSDSINLKDLLYNGNAKFKVANNEAEYSEQLKNIIDIYSEVRNSSMNMERGHIRIGDTNQVGEGFLTNAWNDTKEFWEQIKNTGEYNGVQFGSLDKSIVAKHSWAILPQISAMESVELSQGYKGFNTARFAMRDQFMSIGTRKPEIIKELLSRNMVDTKLLMMEQELLRNSSAAPEKMKELVGKYKDYVKEVYGEKVAESYDKQLHLKEEGALRSDLESSLGATSALDLKAIRENAHAANGTFLSEERNLVGKVILGEDGSIIHFPSSQALGGMTVLADGRVTFEGKDAANVPKFFDLAKDVILNGKVSNRIMEKSTSSMIKLANIIAEDRSKIQIHAATYARNIYDKTLANHDVMKLIDARTGALSGLSGETRSVFGHVTSISSKDASLMIQNELMQAIENIKHTQSGSSKTVVASLNELRSDWIQRDHPELVQKLNSGIIDSEGKLIANERKIAKLTKATANKIVQKKIEESTLLQSRLGTIQEMIYRKDSVKDIMDAVHNTASLIEKSSLKLYGLRDPNIYSSSEAALHGFISKDLTKSSRGSVEKIMALGFSAAANMAADQDGDKVKFLMLFSGKSEEAAIDAVKGSQRKSEQFLTEAKERIKLFTGRPDGKRQVLDFSDEMLSKVVGQVFGQERASMAAAFVTKAYTGALNISALGTKGKLHEAIARTKGTSEEIESLLAFVNTIPSLFTEQQAISAKKLTNYIGKGLEESKTPIETLIENIGRLDQHQVMDLIKETGTVDPMVITQLGKISLDRGKRGAYAEAIELADTVLGYQSGYNRVTAEQLNKFKPYLKGSRNDDEWENFVTSVLEKQNNTTPIVETNIAREANLPSSIVELFGKSHQATGHNPDKILKTVANNLKDSGTSFNDITMQELSTMIEDERGKAFRVSEELYGTGVDSLVTKAARRPIGWNKLQEKIEPAVNWIKEAPLQRLGGLAMLGVAVTATMNILSGSTIDSVDDVPSMNNPGMEASPRTYGSGGTFSGSYSNNRSHSLLTSGNLSGRQTINSVNSLIGNSGFHSINVRNDNTNPYIDKMSYYN